MNSNLTVNDRKLLGSYGENIAAAFLEKKGFQILCRNFRCRTGEIDIIVKDGSVLSFTEVKLRKNSCFGEAREFVTPKKQRRIISASEYYILKNEKELYRIFRNEPQPRFDIVEVYLPNGIEEKAYVRLTTDAFSL